MSQASVESTSTNVLKHFVDQGYLSIAQFNELTASTNLSLKVLMDNGLVPERIFAEVVATVYQAQKVRSDDFPKAAIEGTSVFGDFLIEHEALPLSFEGGVLSVAVSDPSDEFIFQVLRSKLNCEVKPYIAQRSALVEALISNYSRKADSNELNSDLDLPDDIGSDSSLVRDIHRLIQRAVTLDASDIHFEPVGAGLRVRFRVHGMLRNIHTFDGTQREQVVARLKLMSKLDVTQRRDAQNGRFKFPADGRVIDLRVSTLPLHDGESIVLRLLEFELSQLSLQQLGFSDAVADSIQQTIQSQQGLVLVTGPTGSGKSTTLYSLLNQLNQPELKLISIEDPVELNIAGVNQIQVDEEYGISFSAALKTDLRQDPDVIMIGEIRDSKTAHLAAQAALTGHLVLATLHTASAASAVTRLYNLGLPEYLVASTVKAVLAQRLLRRVCERCSGVSNESDCPQCAGNYYFGRTTIAELLPASAFKQTNGLTEDELSERLLGSITLADDANALLERNIVDQNEVFRVLGADV